jgi:hypothetical protein
MTTQELTTRFYDLFYSRAFRFNIVMGFADSKLILEFFFRQAESRRKAKIEGIPSHSRLGFC